MFKYGTLGGLRNAKDNPRTKAVQELFNGMVVIPDDVTGEAPVPATAADAKGEVYVVNNIVDKPEIRNSTDFKIEAGEFVHADLVSAVAELPVQIDESVLVTAYADVAVNDILVASGDGSGKWVKADGTAIIAADYRVNLVVTKKTAFGQNGLDAKVKIN